MVNLLIETRISIVFHSLNSFTNQNLNFQRNNSFCETVAQRLALSAAGERKAWKQNPSKAKKSPKNAQTPSDPMHVVLGTYADAALKAKALSTFGALARVLWCQHSRWCTQLERC